MLNAIFKIIFYILHTYGVKIKTHLHLPNIHVRLNVKHAFIFLKILSERPLVFYL